MDESERIREEGDRQCKTLASKKKRFFFKKKKIEKGYKGKDQTASEPG